MYINFYQNLSLILHKQKSAEDKIKLNPVVLEKWMFLDLVDEVAIKIFVYLLITNLSLYESTVNLIKDDMKTQILFKLIKTPFDSFQWETLT